LRITGFGCLEAPAPAGVRCDAGVVEAGVIRLDAQRSIADRLVELNEDVSALLGRTRPDLVAVEQLFAHPEHPATSIAMAHARGVILLRVRAASVPLVELRPSQVKKALTSFGQAGKRQVQAAVKAELLLDVEPSPSDVADALAIALCALRRRAVADLPSDVGTGFLRGRTGSG
jgi:crossover junction endodeoxyribonuclease RuvC